MTIERTKEMDELCERTIFLIDHAEKCERHAKLLAISVFVFAVIGIFFIPCLIVAVLLFCLRRWSLSQYEIATEELDRINEVPGIHAYLSEYAATRNS